MHVRTWSMPESEMSVFNKYRHKLRMQSWKLSPQKPILLQPFAYSLAVRGIFVNDERRLGLHHKPCLGDFRRTKAPPRSPEWP
ncbi:hypothetical protein ARMSODRAFT_67294 [Armillaria solidipes]|uniref:Uncharacterized protein n=1 Tax=Armillaria solidipes TaxID=1076256 RepID=A0A2H3BK07_9AGAR|nr:hypothetical protein ARMSODRAFT_67294 [Armillaria solidipes]